MTHQPEKTSKSRIKRLRGLRRPHCRLRIDQMRVFYDVDRKVKRVEILRILPKLQAKDYLTEEE